MMKIFGVYVIGLLVMTGLIGCEVIGPSVRVQGPKVKIPGVRIVDISDHGKFCPPGQAKKGRC